MQTVEMHPEFLGKNGEREFALIPYTEFVALKEYLADIQDLLDLEESIRFEETSEGVPLEEVERRYGLLVSG